jgi:hypothetical protein
MNEERFRSWQLVRVRGRGPYKGSAWRVAAHIYRDRAINCMEAIGHLQQGIHAWEKAYEELEQRVSLPNQAESEPAQLEETQWTIATIEPGTLFKADGVYAVKSEYHLAHGACMCILLASGEYGYFSEGDATSCEVVDMAGLFSDLADASRQLDDLRNALEAQSRTVARMRAALEEAEEELGRGELLHALAAIGRGLNEGRT